MVEVQFFDRTQISSREITPEGYLLVGARLARVGVQYYTRDELGMDGDSNAMVGIYRPDAEVFDARSMKSFALQPVTYGHPPDDRDWETASSPQG